MQQTSFRLEHNTRRAAMLSLMHPNKEFLQRHRSLLRRAITAGFPSPADDFVEHRLSLDEYLVEHNKSIFFMRVAGNSMCGAGILKGDLLVVDRSLPVMDSCVVIAVVDGEFTVKQLRFTAQGPVLHAAHPDYPDIPARQEQDFSIWGVVKWMEKTGGMKHSS